MSDKPKKFRLLVGRHVDNHPRGKTERVRVIGIGGTEEMVERPVQVTYAAIIRGENPIYPVFESRVDLCAKFNMKGVMPKFESVPDDTPCIYDGDPDMTEEPSSIKAPVKDKSKEPVGVK